jgi:type II secretory pathway predicted ATPase ExeA
MYKNFYGLKRSPFEISPDPYFLFPTVRHNEALASIYYGVCRRKGFLVMTGEVGTGKTLLVRCLLELLSRQQVAFANVFNSRLSPLDFLRYAVGDLGLKPADQSKSGLLLELNNYLIARYRKGQTTALIVDEAQHLSWEVLEEIRLLSNLETTQQKLLQIVLVGQPELEQKLDAPDLRQLKQRIALRCRLEPLNEEETHGYIVRRLKLAGADGRSETIFPKESIAAVRQHSRGIPRLINTICENALIAAYAHRLTAVVPEIVDEVSREFRLGVSTPANGNGSAGQEVRNEHQALLRAIANLLESLKSSDTASNKAGVS